ncbi:MAG: hypothetical protein IJ711_01445 [Lachnospiraceae bacterium]|nr:hypothetical protein [Lachnospiraceae bacterium]
MDTQATGILAYIPVVGWLLAYFTGDREGAKFHLNQGLVLHIFLLLTWIPFLGWLFGIFLIVCWIIGLVGAVNGEEREVPLLGAIRILK